MNALAARNSDGTVGEILLANAMPGKIGNLGDGHSIISDAGIWTQASASLSGSTKPKAFRFVLMRGTS
jgi:hypothetical protein